MFKLALKSCDVKSFKSTTCSEARQLDSSISLEGIQNYIINEVIGCKKVINAKGVVGSGRSTFTQALVKNLIQCKFIKNTEVLYLEITASDTVDSLVRFAFEFAKKNGEHNMVTPLGSGNQEDKVITTSQLLSKFKLICFDELQSGDNKLLQTILSLIEKLDTIIICITNSQSTPILGEVHRCVEIHGLHKDIAFEEQTRLRMKTSFQNLQFNAKGIKLYRKACHEFGDFDVSPCGHGETPVQKVCKEIWSCLDDLERSMVQQLTTLQQPLPLKEYEQCLKKPISVGFVDFVPNGNKGGFVSVSSAIKEFVKSIINLNIVPSSPTFDLFALWHSLLLGELQGLVANARKNSWPFVPEKWQYSTDAGEESSNVKDLLTAKHEDFTDLSQADILQECLHHATLRNDYENVHAIVFVLDRFVYWQGNSRTLLDIVESIKKAKPLMPIAPQLVIREARILRTSGDLQSAEMLLDRLLNEEDSVGMWRYKYTHDYTLVKAVSIQIKGEIQSSMGQWFTAAKHLLDSIKLFECLPKEDKKGLSCSLGLLVNVLQNISVNDYQKIRKEYERLEDPSPYLQAYQFAQEAAEKAKVTPLFFARHKRRAGEMLVEYTEKQSTHLHGALGVLQQSLKAHKTMTSLNSREQYYEFIAALYKTSCVPELLTVTTSNKLKSLSKQLYDHYCQCGSMIVHDGRSQQLVNEALTMLELPSLALLESESSTLTNRSAIETDTNGSGIGENFPTVDRNATTVDRLKTTVGTRQGFDNNLPNIEDCSIVDNDSRVHECESARYDAVNKAWKRQKTLVYIGEPLELKKGKAGAQRTPFIVQYLNQDEPMGKYIGKQYKQLKLPEQYEKDVRCQMVARSFVGGFNQAISRRGVNASHIEFLPVVMVTLLNSGGTKTKQVYNIEPYIHGNFVKLTNNALFVRRDGVGSQLVLAFSHYTFEKSDQTMVIVDHQGWTTPDHLARTFLTDPQIHSIDGSDFGTGNLHQDGIDKFWKYMHTECNEICRQLGLKRPQKYNQLWD